MKKEDILCCIDHTDQLESKARYRVSLWNAEESQPYLVFQIVVRQAESSGEVGEVTCLAPTNELFEDRLEVILSSYREGSSYYEWLNGETRKKISRSTYLHRDRYASLIDYLVFFFELGEMKEGLYSHDAIFAER